MKSIPPILRSSSVILTALERLRTLFIHLMAPRLLDYSCKEPLQYKVNMVSAKRGTNNVRIVSIIEAALAKIGGV